MPVSFGAATITAIYLGTTSIVSAYLGSTQVFGGASAFTPLSLFSGGAQGVWYDPSDLSTMFSDRAGTTPVTTPGTVVGLRLDKSKGLVLGAELVTNGTFDTNLNGWTNGNTHWQWTSPGGALHPSSSVYNELSWPLSLVAGRTYVLTFEVVSLTSGTLRLVAPFDLAVTTTGTKTFRYLATGAETRIGFARSFGTTLACTLDNISVRELAGNHAVAPTDAARPIYGIEPKGGRRSLLTYSEQFNAASWLVFGGASKTGTDIAVAPDGTTTADSIRVTTAGTGSNVYQNQTYTVSAVPYTFSCWVKRNAASDQTFQLFNNLQGAQVSSGNLTATDTWQRFSLTSTSNAGSGVMLIGIIGNTSGAQADLLVWGAQLELGSTATAYQRVTTAYDVTESGVPTCHYVQYDGSDDSMSTAAIDFTATDKMSVFAGVRKLSDSGTGMLLELSVNAVGAAGAFYLAAPDSPARYSFFSHGNATGVSGHAATLSTGTAPDSAVITATGDIPADLNTLSRNGVPGTSATADQGTGNFRNDAIYIGRRGNSSLPFFGRDFGIIVVGKAASAGEITDTETWLAAKTAQVTL